MQSPWRGRRGQLPAYVSIFPHSDRALPGQLLRPFKTLPETTVEDEQLTALLQRMARLSQRA